MNDSLETQVEQEYWGYIYLDRDGEIIHKRKTSPYPVIRKIGTLLEAIYTATDLFILPRDKHSYQGMISWHQDGDVISFYGLVVHPDTSLNQISLLHQELIAIAQERSDVKWIYSSTWVPKKIMERLGYEYVKEDVGGLQKYRRPVNHE